MNIINKKELPTINGGWIDKLLKGMLAGIGFVIGKDVEEVWDEGWEDPYGKD